jgi:hypothetical protein
MEGGGGYCIGKLRSGRLAQDGNQILHTLSSFLAIRLLNQWSAKWPLSSQINGELPTELGILWPENWRLIFQLDGEFSDPWVTNRLPENWPSSMWTGWPVHSAPLISLDVGCGGRSFKYLNWRVNWKGLVGLVGPAGSRQICSQLRLMNWLAGSRQSDLSEVLIINVHRQSRSFTLSISRCNHSSLLSHNWPSELHWWSSCDQINFLFQKKKRSWPKGKKNFFTL